MEEMTALRIQGRVEAIETHNMNLDDIRRKIMQNILEPLDPVDMAMLGGALTDIDNIVEEIQYEFMQHWIREANKSRWTRLKNCFR